MKVDELKEKARRFEQKEDWSKALDLYRQAISSYDDDEPPDITLYNRVGDIQTRLGQIDGAVEQYEKAIELYLEAELPNNAIAICKKVLRNLPDRNIFFLRMGQIRASQGFLTDARVNFLTYAERMTEGGELDAAMDALIEFVDLSPEDVEIRLGLASQLESHYRTEESVNQYSEAYRRLILMDREEEAGTVRTKLGEMAPDLILPDPQSIRAGAAVQAEEEPAMAGGFGEFALGAEDGEEAAEVAVPEPEVEVEVEAEFGEIEIGGGEDVEEEEEMVLEAPLSSGSLESAMEEAAAEVEEEEAEEEDMGLPTFGFEDEMEVEVGGIGDIEGSEAAADADEGDMELPTFGFEEGDDAEAGDETEEAEPLPGLDSGAFGEADQGDREGREYVDETEALPELEVELSDLSVPEAGDEVDAGEAAEETELGASDAMEAAIEEALAEEPLAEEPVQVEEPAQVEESASGDHQAAAEAGDLEGAMAMVRTLIRQEPDEVEHYQRLVEYAFRTSDQDVLIPAYLDLAACLARTGSTLKAKAVYQQVLSLSPGHEGAQAGIAEMEGTTVSKPTAQVASSEEYVDLGSMILGEEEEKTTRWRVATDAPSGDDQADFAKMLSQFKEKVSEHVDADDVAAHHDLGTAYMEMGLLDEAISEFQMALRASPDHLPTHEVMGRCWMEMDKPEMAVRALGRALQVRSEIEDELIGIYYLMGRAKEDLGNTEEAVEFYEKVFSLDINFEDVTERLRALR